MKIRKIKYPVLRKPEVTEIRIMLSSLSSSAYEVKINEQEEQYVFCWSVRWLLLQYVPQQSRSFLSGFFHNLTKKGLVLKSKVFSACCYSQANQERVSPQIKGLFCLYLFTSQLTKGQSLNQFFLPVVIHKLSQKGFVLKSIFFCLLLFTS